MNKNQTLNEECFKIDRVNGWSMIEGIIKNDKSINQAIYCVTNQSIWGDKKCRLITYDDTIPYEKYLSTDFGIPMRDKHKKDPKLKYIAVTDTLYEIKLDEKLWDILCYNGLFDIWQPKAPMERYNDYFKRKYENEKFQKRQFAKKDLNKEFFLGIALIRLYEIEGNGFSRFDFYKRNEFDFAPHLDTTYGKSVLNVIINRPVICKNEFIGIKNELEKVLQGSSFLVKTIPVVNTTANDNFLCDKQLTPYNENDIPVENKKSNSQKDSNSQNENKPERILNPDEILEFLVDTFDDLKIILNSTSKIEKTSSDFLELSQKDVSMWENLAPEVKQVITKKIERGNLANKVKKFVNYECLICKKIHNTTQSFKKSNGDTYVEVHHVEPVSGLKKGSLSLANIITVCANHHRQLHYGNVEYQIENDYFTFNIDKQIITIDKINLDNVK